MYNRSGIWQYASTEPKSDPTPIDRGNLPAAAAPLDATNPRNYLSVPLDMIPTDIALPCALYVKITDKFVLFRKAKDTLTQARAASLSAPSNGVIYVSKDEWNHLLHSLEAIVIATEQANQPADELARGLQIRNLLFAYAREIEASQNFTADLLKRIEALASRLATTLHQNPTLSGQLLRRYQDPVLYHINHAVNVAIYSLAIAQKQNLALAATKMLAFAALVHNVGNIMVPAEILFKPGELTPEEKHAVDQHILHGATMLQNLAAPKEVVLTAMQHHDRFDGQGEKNHPSGTDIHLFARICSIADVFDAITNYRPYHMLPLSPSTAIRRMTDMKGKFDPAILPVVAEKDGSGI